MTYWQAFYRSAKDAALAFLWMVPLSIAGLVGRLVAVDVSGVTGRFVRNCTLSGKARIFSSLRWCMPTRFRAVQAFTNLLQNRAERQSGSGMLGVRHLFALWDG